MIEALISTRPNGETRLDKRGDVLLVRPYNSVWGKEEIKVHRVVEWNDTILEERLQNEEIITYPYSIYDEDDEGSRVMLIRSYKYLDINALSSIFDDILNPQKAFKRLSWDEIKDYIKVRPMI